MTKSIDATEVVRLTQQLYALISHLDERRYEEIADMFVPQGRWLRQGRWLEGREAILAGLRARPADMRVRHLFSNVWVTAVEGDEARAEATMTAFRQLPGRPPELFTINRVHTVFCRDGDGWLIREQQMVREFEFTVA
ncbi:nuclear transport factor 2 family protein [Ramlibacter rhizophilus]|nr:nuclear transport factor 2 family protein [Ramlibacter rhizophilus]